MSKSIVTALSASVVLLLMPNLVDAAEIRVIQGGGLKEAFLELTPRFENQSGHKITNTLVGFADIPKRLAAGETFDVVLSAGVEVLIKQGKIVAGSSVELARSGVGVAVKSGAPKPDIGTVDAFKRTLLAARSLVYSSGASGRYLVELFQQMGVSEEIKGKSQQVPSEIPVGAVLARGEAEIGFQQVSELIVFPGVDFVGPIPAEVQRYTAYFAAIPTTAREVEAATVLIKFLSSPIASPTYRKVGMEPVAQ
jgi:molybdate transport system substrate-binding protein